MKVENFLCTVHTKWLSYCKIYTCSDEQSLWNSYIHSKYKSYIQGLYKLTTQKKLLLTLKKYQLKINIEWNTEK